VVRHRVAFEPQERRSFVTILEWLVQPHEATGAANLPVKWEVEVEV
jgi:hypothetical protein